MNHKLDTHSEVFFYEQEFYVLSNFSAFSLLWKGLRFDTSEAAYQWEKFKSTDPEVASQILHARSAHDAFTIARENRSKRREDWDEVKVDIMACILKEKVEQHDYVKKKLLETGDRELIEDSWLDSYWGTGPDGKGLNRLGLTWESIRAEVREEEQSDLK